MKFWCENELDGSNVVLSASSEDSEWPVENLQNEHRRKVFTTGDSNADEWITADFGAPVSFNSLIVFAHNLEQTDSNLYVQAHSSPSWGSPEVDEEVTWASGAIVHEFSATKTYQYARFKFTKNDAGETRSIGRIFFGMKQTFTDPDWNGYKVKKKDLTRLSWSVGHLPYANIKGKYREISIRVSGYEYTEKQQYDVLEDYSGIGKSMFLQVTDDGDFTEYIYGYLRDLNQHEVEGQDSESVWKTSIEFEEAV